MVVPDAEKGGGGEEAKGEGGTLQPVGSTVKHVRTWSKGETPPPCSPRAKEGKGEKQHEANGMGEGA